MTAPESAQTATSSSALAVPRSFVRTRWTCHDAGGGEPQELTIRLTESSVTPAAT